MLKRLKERGLTFSQIRGYLPFKIDSSPIYVRWLLLAQYSIDELEEENIEWKHYFKELPVDVLLGEDEYEKYQYDGVLPLELLKAGIDINTIRNIYEIKDFPNVEETQGLNVLSLKEKGFTAKAFFNMGKALDEIIDTYSYDRKEDIRELAISEYDLKALRRRGFSIQCLKEEYENVLHLYGLDNYGGQRYKSILDFINKHGG